jgi:ribosomal protein S18 acetylase RimI-like enzyme
MKIRYATPDDVSAVVQIHILAFPGFFLTTLGVSFLKELYLGFKQPSGIFLVAEDNNQIIGFAVGTTNPDVFFNQLRKKRGLHFLFKAIPALAKNTKIVFKKIVFSIFYKGDKPTELVGGTLLSSIGVAPFLHGSQVGSKLLNRFEEVAFSQNATFIYLTTDALANERTKAFYHKNGYSIESSFSQLTERPMLRYIKYNNPQTHSTKDSI